MEHIDPLNYRSLSLRMEEIHAHENDGNLVVRYNDENGHENGGTLADDDDEDDNDGNLVVRYEDFSAGVKLAWARKLASKIHGVLQDPDPSFLERQVQMLELLEAADLGE